MNTIIVRENDSAILDVLSKALKTEDLLVHSVLGGNYSICGRLFHGTICEIYR